MTSYADFVPSQRFWFELSISPAGDAVAYSADTGSGQFNLIVHPLDGSTPQQLTDFTDQAVRQIAWSPDGQTVYFTADRDGDEFFQVFRIGRDTRGLKALTDADKVQHSLGFSPASPDGSRLAYAGNDREPTDKDLLLRELGTGEVTRALARDSWFEPGHWSPDGRSLSVLEFRSNTDIGLAVLRIETNETMELLVDQPGKHLSAGWSASGDVLYVTTDAGRDFVGLAAVDISTGELQWLANPDWDVEFATVSVDGRVLVWSVNVDGISQLHAMDIGTGQPLDMPEIPPGTARAMSVSADGNRIALLIATGGVPFNVLVVDLADHSARWLTDARPKHLDPASFREPETVSYPTHDGHEIPAYLYRPSGDGPFGIVLSIHGGPEWQERPCYNYEGLYQYWLSKGIGVLAPNVRGSTGYGTAYQKLIHHDWGGDELKDFEHAHRYLTTLDWVDPTRIGVFGGSFGGFATLSCVSRLPDLWAAGVSIVGPSNLVTFCRSVPPTWRRTMAEWVGDVETEEEFLLERSPISYVDDIVAPLFVIQGAKDPRVVKAESDQIVDRLRGRGVDVRYDVYDDEGHGFIRRKNETKALADTADFLISHLRRRDADATRQPTSDGPT